MSGLRVVDPDLLALGLSLPGLARRAGALSELPPLGLLTVAAMVAEPWQVQLVSDQGVGSVDDTVARILRTRPNVVAFSSLTPAIDRAKAISGRLRQSSVTTIIGGLHATAAPQTCQDSFDAVAIGDGESTIGKLLSDWGSGSLAKRYQPSKPFDLADAPMPRWDLLGDAVPPRYTLQTLRGCPWACSFCAASRLLGPPRAKPITRIADELSVIRSRQPRPWIELADDNTFASDRDHGALLDQLRQAGARWFTESDWRIADQPKLLRKIATSGCRQILVGLESPVFRYPGMGGKTAQWQAMMRAAEKIQQAGIVVNACFIVGADGETRESIDRLAEYLEDAPLGEIQVTLQTPFPGTSLHQSLKQDGRLLFDDFSRYTLFDVVFEPDQMGADALRGAFKNLIRRVYSPAAQAKRNAIVKGIRRIAKQLARS